MICPHCRKSIRTAIVLSEAASIQAKRKNRGCPLTSEQARLMAAASQEARRRNRREAGGTP